MVKIKKIILALLLLLLLFTVLTIAVAFYFLNSKEDSWFKMGNNEIGLTTFFDAKLSAIEWNRVYRCGREVKLVYSPNTSEIATGEPGVIHLPLKEQAGVIVLHELTHACQKDITTPVAIPFLDGLVTGFHGLTLKVHTFDGKDTNFVFIEEGAAEAIAHHFDTYHSPNYGYYNLGKLICSTGKSSSTIWQWVKNNDVPSLIRAQFNLPSDHIITTEDINRIMILYAEEYNKGKKILDERKATEKDYETLSSKINCNE